MKFLHALALSTSLSLAFATAEELTILHVGDQETWLLSAQGNLRDDATQPLSFYGGIDRLATRLDQLRTAAISANRSVLLLNAGDVILPGPRFNASLTNLATAAFDGGQDYYDSIAFRQIAWDATVFGNHEFDFGLGTAARFAELSVTSANPYLSFNLNFSANISFSTLQGAGKVATHKIFTTTGGNNVAVIGVTTPLLPSVSSPATLPLMTGYRGFNASANETTNVLAMVPELQTLIDDLRGNQSVTVVILLSHLQNFAVERDILVPALTGVDLVVSGGGHELQTSPTSITIPTTSPVFGPALPSPPIAYPTFSNDEEGNPTPIVTANFGNRYIGEITLDLDDITGEVTGIVPSSNRVVRVSGRSPADVDAVTGNATLFSSVVTPVKTFIDGLNASVIATTEVNLNGERGLVGGNRSFTTGVRNSQTNLGSLVADSLRFATGADVSIQNGGGVRATIAGPTPPTLTRNVTIGDTFNTLTFLNLVVVDETVTASQLKAVLEHGFAASTPTGSPQGRFPQLSGVDVIFDTTRPVGQRVRRVNLILDPNTPADDVLLVDYGRVLDNSTEFSVATIDFLANGGDGYPFIANGFTFVNPPVSRNYQEALADYLTTASALGGIEGEVLTAEYPVANAFNRTTRTFDMMLGSGTRETLNGTPGGEFIEGGPGAQTMDGGAGADTFVYRGVRDALDTINNFELGTDVIHVRALLESIGVVSSPEVLGENLTFTPTTGGATLNYVIPGRPARPLAFVRGTGVTPATLNSPANFVF
jgi:5'-nucleotidase